MGILHNECGDADFTEHYFFFSNGLILMMRAYRREDDDDMLVDLDATTVNAPLAVGMPFPESLPIIERWAQHNILYREMCNLDAEVQRLCEVL